MDCELILQDGSCFKGTSFGADVSISGEVVFNTGMVGYPESFTDPSYAGQILVLTYPLIGNYGVPAADKDSFGISKNFESDKIQIQALVVSEYSKEYSHYTATKSLAIWLKENNIPAICNVDTRALTKKLREHGVMLGKIIMKKDSSKKIKFDDPNLRNLVAEVSIKEPVVYKNKPDSKKVILVDCGAKNNILRSLLARGLTVIKVPWDYDFMSGEYEIDGIMLSNGPGNPKMCTSTISNIKKAISKKIPIFGICLGNQLLALAAGADTYKLKYGHRSQNQPCYEVGTKRCYVTSQNHGFAVDEKKLPAGWLPWMRNANDQTNEGIMHKSGLFSSVQYHPEHMCGPTDNEYLFDRFVELITKKSK